MSRIWTALPLRTSFLDRIETPPDARWWRHPLLPGPDEHLIVVRTDAVHDQTDARIGCWEFFDGCEEQLILGVDVFDSQQIYEGRVATLYLLAVDVPTKSKRWQPVTEPGDWYLDARPTFP